MVLKAIRKTVITVSYSSASLLICSFFLSRDLKELGFVLVEPEGGEQDLEG